MKITEATCLILDTKPTTVLQANAPTIKTTHSASRRTWFYT